MGKKRCCSNSSASARERVYLSYQRARAAGVPWPHRGIWMRSARCRRPASRTRCFPLPRRWSERRDLSLFVPPLLTREELTVSAVLRGRDVSALLDLVGRRGRCFPMAWLLWALWNKVTRR